MGCRALKWMGWVAFGLALLPGGATAAEVHGSVHFEKPGAAFAPESVVVFLTGFEQPPLPKSVRIEQKNKTFLPALRVIVAGESVEFSNDDVVLHNVFSTSNARPFDLGKPGPGERREVKFPRPGLVDVYCNIHENMSASVLVLPNRAFAFVDASGAFVLHDVPAGTHVLHVYGRELDPVSADVWVEAANAAVTVPPLTVRPRAFKLQHLDKYGRPYRAHPGYDP